MTSIVKLIQGITYIHLNISSFSYHHHHHHHQDLQDLIANMSIKITNTVMSESGIIKGKIPINNIYLPNSSYEHSPTGSKKGGALL